MLKYPCLVLDHDDTVVQSERTVNYPYFRGYLLRKRPDAVITPAAYTEGCFSPGFAEMCRQWYGFSEEELAEEYLGWKEYVRSHVPDPFPGIGDIIRLQKELGGLVCVVSHSCEENICRDYRTHFGVLPDAIYGWDLPEELRKPAVYPLTDIMARFSLTARELLVVDDLKPGRDMAESAGVDCCFARWGRADSPLICRQMESLCRYSFSSPEALGEFLFRA